MADNLPDKILQHIFSYLNACQRLDACLVCKTWLRALDCPYLLEDIYVINKGNSMLHELHDTTRKFPSIYFLRTEIDNACINLLNHIGPQLLHLQFNTCFLRHQSLYIHRIGEKNYEPRRLSQVHNCKNLKSLKYNPDIWVIFSYLPNLESVHTGHSSALNDRLVIALDEIIPSTLKKLSMPCNVVCDTTDYIEFYPKLKIFENPQRGIFENPSNRVLSFPVMAHFIRKRSKTLMSLKLHGSTALEFSNGLILEQLSLDLCEIGVDAIPDLCRSQPRLVKIDLSYISFLRDDIVNEVCLILPNLQKFKAKGTSMDDSVESVFRMRHLKKINLSMCSAITPNSFTRAVTAFAADDLRFLDLGETCIEALSLQQLFPRVKRLTYLNLVNCHQVSDTTLVAISRHLLLLRELILEECSDITDDGLTGRCDAIPVPLSNLRGLIRLNMSGCHQITGAGVMEAICFSHLSELNLSNCPNLTSMNVNMVWEQNPHLDYFHYFHQE